MDGAKRGDGSSSAGLAMVAYHPDREPTILCRAGSILGVLSSSFAAELLALEWSLDFYTNLINKGIILDEVMGR